MKRTLLFFILLIISISGKITAQTLVPESVPPTVVGTTATISFAYTSNVSCAMYAELRIANIDSNGVITQDYSVGSNYIQGAFSAILQPTAEPVTATVNLPVPSSAVPSANLPAGKTYSWVYKLTPGINDYSEVGTTFQYTGATILATNNVVDTLVLDNPPVEIVAGSEVTITVNYTCPAARLIKFGIAIYNANGFVSDLVGTGVDNLPATTTSPVSLSQTLTIPESALPSSALPAGQFYKVDTALFTPAFASYIAGASSDVNLVPLSITDLNRKSISIYPNPTQSELNFSGDTEIKSAEIYNAMGKLVLANPTLYLQKIDVSTLSSGIYFLKINNAQTLKFVKN